MPDHIFYIAWAPHCSCAFRADTERGAQEAARNWAWGFGGSRPTWKRMAREGWRITKIVEEVSRNA